jgi:PDZ domain-containing protein
MARPAIQAIETVRSLIDTQDETLTPHPPPPSGTARPPWRGHRWWALPLAGLGIATLVVVAVAALLPASLVADKEVADPADPDVQIVEATPYARVPASAQRVDDRISFGQLEGVADIDENRRGDIYFVTISEPSQSLLSYWVGNVEPEIDFLTRDEKYGTATPSQRRQIGLEQMRTAEQVAQYVALQAIGFDGAELRPGDVVVAQLVCLEPDEAGCAVPAPADEVLDPGDKILRVDGVAVATVEDLVAQLADNAPGDVVELDIERPDAAPQTVEVELIASPDDPDRTIIGFIPFDTASIELPFEIDIDTGQIGGPSAGLAFTLTLIDELSEGDLTGGTDVAVTGEIGVDGSVGAIGGLAQKVSAVRQVGVRHFLVPTAQGEEQLARAREIAGDDVEIIPVATLDEALAALERLGGDPVVPVD